MTDSGSRSIDRSRVALAFAGYTAASFGIALMIHPVAPDQYYGTGWIILLMLIVVGVCMYTERGGWELWKRLLAVPGAWIAHGILQFVAIPVGFMLYSAGLAWLVDYVIVYLASVPLVLWAMWRSRLFVPGCEEAGRSAAPGSEDAVGE